MFKVSSISIENFWQKYAVACSFDKDVNIVIGRNGTGKTTFMNLLHAVLSADVDELFEHDFTKITVTLTNGNKTKTIKAEKSDADAFPIVTYHISRRRFTLMLASGPDVRSFGPSYRRRALEQSNSIKQELSEYISLASLSVYRIGADAEVNVRESAVKKSRSPVDQRLNDLMVRLTHFQLELSDQALKISTKLQRDVLKSLLYEKEKIPRLNYRIFDFDETQEKSALVAAYSQLGVRDSDIQKRIQEHIAEIALTIGHLKADTNGKGNIPGINLAALEARNRTKKVVDLSLIAKEATKALYNQITLFLKTLEEFILDKKFEFNSGDLSVKNGGDITINRLSSGEKQLLILFIEALLQRQQPFIFLADEPELSLHISWQRQIIGAIRSLNPNAQIIVATHSPEVAGPFRDKIINMADIRHE